MQKEIWKPVVGYENFYKVSNLGRVKALKREVINNGRVIMRKGYIKKLTTMQNGYKTTALTKNGATKSILVHRLVASAFLINPHRKPFVNHIDESRDNNNVCNLEWCTHKENMNHGTAFKRRYNTIIRNKSRMKAVCKCDLNGNVLKVYVGLREAKRDGFDNGAISKICRGIKCKTHKGYRWRYATEKESLQGQGKFKEICRE